MSDEKVAGGRVEPCQGADLTTFDYGYANIGGSFDEHTRLPEGGECTTDEADNTFNCLR